MDFRHTPRLFVNQDLDQGQTLTITDDQAHYLQHVLRMKAGDTARLFNGRDGEWAGQIASLAKKSVNMALHEQLRPHKAEPDIWLCCAPIKKAHFEYLIEKATELGVSDIRPLLTARTQIREVNVERCSAIATEAAEQSDRLDVPSVQKPVTLAELAASFPTDRALIVCAEWGEALPLHEAFMSPALTSFSKMALVTGPEGGFAADELEKLKTVRGNVFIRLGPRILRADTAAIAALSCWQALRGDWRQA